MDLKTCPSHCQESFWSCLPLPIVPCILVVLVCHFARLCCRDKITCLCVNVDSTQLVSGSHDMLVKIWDIPGRACLRTIAHKGTVNLLLDYHHIAYSRRVSVSRHNYLMRNNQYTVSWLGTSLANQARCLLMILHKR